MEYFIYSIDIDNLEKINKIQEENNIEEMLIELKTNGEYITSYTEKQYYELIAKIGESNAKKLNKETIDLVELKSIYENIGKEFEDETIRDFKIAIFKPISECKCVYILKMEREIEEKKKNVLDILKDKIKNRLGRS